jgi:nicotinate phosphoribosyltransferase
VGHEPLEVARERHASARAELPHTADQMSKGEPVIPTEFV